MDLDACEQRQVLLHSFELKSTPVACAVYINRSVKCYGAFCTQLLVWIGPRGWLFSPQLPYFQLLAHKCGVSLWLGELPSWQLGQCEAVYPRLSREVPIAGDSCFKGREFGCEGCGFAVVAELPVAKGHVGPAARPAWSWPGPRPLCLVLVRRWQAWQRGSEVGEISMAASFLSLRPGLGCRQGHLRSNELSPLLGRLKRGLGGPVTAPSFPAAMSALRGAGTAWGSLEKIIGLYYCINYNLARGLGNRGCPEVVEMWGRVFQRGTAAVILLGFTNKISLSNVFVTLWNLENVNLIYCCIM